MGLPIFFDYDKQPSRPIAESKTSSDPTAAARSSIRRGTSIHRRTFPRVPRLVTSHRQQEPPRSPAPPTIAIIRPGSAQGSTTSIYPPPRDQPRSYQYIPTRVERSSAASQPLLPYEVDDEGTPANLVAPSAPTGLGDRVRSPSPMDPVVSAWDAARANLDASLEAVDSTIADHMLELSTLHQAETAAVAAATTAAHDCVSDSGSDDEEAENPLNFLNETTVLGPPPGMHRDYAAARRRLRARRLAAERDPAPDVAFEEWLRLPPAVGRRVLQRQLDEDLAASLGRRRQQQQEDEDLATARPLLERLSGRDDIPDEWWRSLGLQRHERHE